MPSKDNFDLPTANDDLYLASSDFAEQGAYYPVDEPERKEAEQTDAAIKAASYPVIPEIHAWFQEQILNASDIHNIETKSVNGYSRSVSIEGQVLAYQLLKELLTDKASEFTKVAEELES